MYALLPAGRSTGVGLATALQIVTYLEGGGLARQNDGRGDAAGPAGELVL